MTSPWPDALVAYRKRQHQKFKVYLTKGVQVNPKAYCCGENTINDQKPPVAVLTVTPNPIYITEFARLDLTDSYDPDSEGIKKWEIWDGQGSPVYARPPGADMFDDVQYNTAGRYEVIGVVTDEDDYKGQASVWLEVLDSPSDPDPDNPDEPPGDWRKSIYLATKVDGIFFTEDFTGPGGADPEWIRVNTGLGTNNTRSIVGDPWDPAYRQYTRTTEPKIYRRTGGDWSVILDDSIALPLISADNGEPVGNLQSIEWNGPTCNINAQGHVYALVGVIRTTDFDRCLYFFKSINYGVDWAVHLISDWDVAFRTPRCLRVGAFQGSSSYAAGQVIYAVAIGTVAGGWALWVSTNQGVGWGASILLWHCWASGEGGDLARSPANQDIIYWVGWGDIAGINYTLRKSTTRGNSWSIIWACAAPPPSIMQRPGIYIWEPLSAFMASGGAGLHWTENDWADYVTYVNADNFPVDGCSRVMDAPELLYAWQINDPVGAEMKHVIAVSDDRGQNWEGKAGDDPVTPSATSIPDDCGGVAGILQIWTEG